MPFLARVTWKTDSLISLIIQARQRVSIRNVTGALTNYLIFVITSFLYTSFVCHRLAN